MGKIVKNTVRTYLMTVFVVLCSADLFALSGAKIIENADNYRKFIWTCNDWNARTSNADTVIQNNDLRYPFYPRGAAIGIDTQGNIIPATGQHTGVPYAWGLRETTDMFGGSDGSSGKLTEKNRIGNNYIVGLLDGNNDKEGIKKIPWFDYYTGIDCSGFVANVCGLPLLSNGKKYWLWHPSAGQLMGELFSDAISWEELKKGDVVAKASHIALVSSSPSGNKVNVIESAIRWGQAYASKVTGNTYTKETGGKIVRDHEPFSATTYIPRRFSPPYLKRLALYVPVMKGGNIDSYRKVYEQAWRNKTDGSGLEMAAVIPSEIIQSDELYVEAEFSKAMAVRTEYGSSWSDMEIKLGSTAASALAFSPVNTEKKELTNICNSGNKIEDGWGGKSDIDNGAVYTKWVGKIETKYYEPGICNIYVNAKSLMQDELDVNPGTIARRTDGGGWSGYLKSTTDERKLCAA